MSPYTKTDCLVHLDNVSLTLGGNQILRNVNAAIFDIIRPGYTQGQIVGFLGPSGVGKTKLFEIIAGIRKPTTGSVRIGTPLQEVQLGQVGVVQQTYPLFDHRSVQGNLMEAARRFPKEERRDRIDAVLGRFGLTQHRDKYPGELSGGQRQRIAIAQQLLSCGNFLLMDEPFSGLDINMIKEVSNTLKEISCIDERNTIIIVSHDISSTAAISDTLWVMGRDRDAEGNIIPGAYIKHTFDLAERGLAWAESSHSNPQFAQLVHEVRSLFPSL
jgi:polar amino acid transport system ATP-binding protein/sulfate transport system ATP-binding protein